MRYMLDTNICIYVIKKKPPEVLERLRENVDQGIAVSTITLAELFYGVEASSYPERNALALHQFLAVAEILPFDDLAAAEYGRIRAELRRLGRPIGALDMLIAAHAKAAGLTLVTNNTREFERVQGLRLVNWTQGDGGSV